MRRSAENFVNYQERAKKFRPGDIVSPFGLLESWTGRIVAVWPGLGMVDVETALGTKRYPAENLQEYVDGNAAPPYTNSTPGGDKWVSVPTPEQKQAKRVASTYAKKALGEKVALYWVGQDRKYRMTSGEVEAGCPCCPRCEGTLPLERAVYKRRDGRSEKLLGCKQCLFLIKEDDIMGLG